MLPTYQKHNKKIKWGTLALICLAGLSWAVFGMDMTGYTLSWAGTAFRALSGACMGWWISRYVINLNLSELEPDKRPLAALSQAIIIAAFTLGLALGV